MSRYSSLFARLEERGEGAFGGFLMLGDPDLETSSEFLDSLVAGGADFLEVGIPFSDPIADGPVIQAAAQRALAAGVRTADCFDLLREFRTRHPDVPVGILTYANLVVARGMERFCSEARMAGVDSLLIADVPALEAEPFAACSRAAGLDFVMIAAPNTPPATLERIAALGSGYTYCVARAGVTGVREDLSLDHSELFGALERLGAPPPVLGFGISTPDQVQAAIAAGAPGVISGSALVRTAAGGDRQEFEAFVAEMKQATRASGVLASG